MLLCSTPERTQVDALDSPDTIYDLCAVVIHIGGQPNRGHYISIVKSHDHWLLFDDDVVEVIDEEEIELFFGMTPAQAMAGKVWS